MLGNDKTSNPQVAGLSSVMRFAPGLQTIRSYRKEDLRPDLLAGLVICLVLVPSALAYAELAGFGPLAGIYSAIAATLAYFLFTSSRHMNVGPDGAVALLVGTAILPLTGGDPTKAVPDRELLALGTANLATGAIQGFSVGGSQTRTLLNSAAGGRTQAANLASVAFLVGFLLLAGDALSSLPKVTIAAILTYTGFGLIEIADVRRIWKEHRQTAWIALTTTGTVVFIGVLPGILLGTAFSIAMLLSELARPHDALLVLKPGSDELHDMGDDDRDEDIPGLVVYRFYGPLFFANVNYFTERLQGFIDDPAQPVRRVIIDARAIPSVDFTAREKLRRFFQGLKDQGLELAIARAHLPLRELTLDSGMEPIFAEHEIFVRVSDAVRDFREDHGDLGG